MKIKALLVVFSILSWPTYLHSQNIEHESEAWIGYIGSFRTSDHWSLWFDFHFVPETFVVPRVGLSYHAGQHWRLTAGYAYARTSTAYSHRLLRGEHRPWAQAEARYKLSKKFNYRLRLRYDARFRDQLLPQSESTTGNYQLINRWRILNDIRFDLKSWQQQKLQAVLMDELLFNSGENITNALDQNRIYALLAWQIQPGLSLNTGYHLRQIPRSNNRYTFRHGITLWFIHQLDLRKKSKAPSNTP